MHLEHDKINLRPLLTSPIKICYHLWTQQHPAWPYINHQQLLCPATIYFHPSSQPMQNQQRRNRQKRQSQMNFNRIWIWIHSLLHSQDHKVATRLQQLLQRQPPRRRRRQPEPLQMLHSHHFPIRRSIIRNQPIHFWFKPMLRVVLSNIGRNSNLDNQINQI